MYIETRYHNSGKVDAKLHKGFSYPHLEDVDTVDRYVESIGKSGVQTDHDNSSDYETLEECMFSAISIGVKSSTNLVNMWGISTSKMNFFIV